MKNYHRIYYTMNEGFFKAGYEKKTRRECRPLKKKGDKLILSSPRSINH